MSFWLKCYDCLGYVLPVIAIVISVLSINFVKADSTAGGGDNAKRKRIINWPVLIIAILLGLTAVVGTSICFVCHEKYTLVPKIYGMTYDDAISELYKNDLQGRLLLASTNEDLANSDSRVVWQSAEGGEVVTRETRVLFVIDDSFALDYVPLNQYKYGDISELTLERSDVLDFKVFFRDVLAQEVNNNKKEEAEREDYPEFKESHWYIEIKPREVDYNFESSVGFRGRSTINVDNTYSYYLYADSMALTLSHIADETARMIGHVSEEYTIVGKLIPTDGSEVAKLKETVLSEDAGIIYLPLVMESGDYSFVVAFLSTEGESYEWYHDVCILTRGQSFSTNYPTLGSD